MTLVISNTRITDNIASRVFTSSVGGGAYLWNLGAESRIQQSTIVSNSVFGADTSGGGVYLDGGSGAIVAHSAFIDNHSQGSGGGMSIFHVNGPVTIEDTDFISNTVESYDTYDNGGAMIAKLTFTGTALYMNRIRVLNNEAPGMAAGLELVREGAAGTPYAHLSNILLSGNQTGPITWPSLEPMMYVQSTGASFDVKLEHMTVTDNPAPTFLSVRGSGTLGQVTVQVYNSLVASSTYAFVGEEYDTRGEVVIQHANTLTDSVATLYYRNNWGCGGDDVVDWPASPNEPTDLSCVPTFQTMSPVIIGDPMLDDTYHLQPGSAAIDRGVNTGLTTDIDGDKRPIGRPDIGADEWGTIVMIPLVMKQAQ